MARLPGFGRYQLASAAVTAAAVWHALHTRGQFYPAAVYLTSSKIHAAVLGNQAFAAMLAAGAAIKAALLGPLGESEVERLFERMRDAVMETCLAMTIFRDEFNAGFVALFVTLLFSKVFHWLLADRVERMPAQADAEAAGVGAGAGSAVRHFHLRATALMALLFAADTALLKHCLQTTMTEGPSVLLLFGFEYLLLASTTLSTFLKYILHTADRSMGGAWEAKSVYLFYVDLVTDLLQLFVYLIFFLIVFVHYGLPIHLIRDLYSTFRNFRQRLSDFVRYRRATNNLSTRFPDATPEEVAADNVCIICREDMEAGAAGSARPKKLACGHVFHLGCLRTWLERQQTCPTCRAIVAPPPANAAPNGAADNAPQAQQQPQQPDEAARAGAAGNDAELLRGAVRPPVPAERVVQAREAARQQALANHEHQQAQVGNMLERAAQLEGRRNEVPTADTVQHRLQQQQQQHQRQEDERQESRAQQQQQQRRQQQQPQQQGPQAQQAQRTPRTQQQEEAQAQPHLAQQAQAQIRHVRQATPPTPTNASTPGHSLTPPAHSPQQGVPGVDSSYLAMLQQQAAAAAAGVHTASPVPSTGTTLRVPDGIEAPPATPAGGVPAATAAQVEALAVALQSHAHLQMAMAITQYHAAAATYVSAAAARTGSPLSPELLQGIGASIPPLAEQLTPGSAGARLFASAQSTPPQTTTTSTTMAHRSPGDGVVTAAAGEEAAGPSNTSEAGTRVTAEDGGQGRSQAAAPVATAPPSPGTQHFIDQATAVLTRAESLRLGEVPAAAESASPGGEGRSGGVEFGVEASEASAGAGAEVCEPSTGAGVSERTDDNGPNSPSVSELRRRRLAHLSSPTNEGGESGSDGSNSRAAP
uniref:RING-type E3 ubiquitin transferase n=1 Tax=Prasinoderma coloniale TaxID=156133 RepID=A0A7R9XYW7_9VIRI